MYKIVGITDLQGKSKDERLKEIKEKYSLYGDFYFEPKCDKKFMFVYDGLDSCFISTNITEIDYDFEVPLIIITTQNSIYYMKYIEELELDWDWEMK